MYASLGDIIFDSLIGYSTLNIKEETDFAEHAKINGKPSLQKIGDKLNKISMNILFSATFCDCEAQVSALSDYRKNASVLAFIYGTGEYVGDYVIESIDKHIIQTNKIGKIIEVTLSISLIEFVSYNKLSDNVAAAKSNGFANSSNSPIRANFIPRQQSEATLLQRQQANIVAYSDTLNKSLKESKKQPNKRDELFKKSSDAISKMQSELIKMQSSLQNAKNAYQSKQRILKALNDTISISISVFTRLGTIGTGNPDELIALNNDMQRAVSRLRYANSETAALSATRRTSFIQP